jgi:hypothetical protein
MESKVEWDVTSSKELVEELVTMYLVKIILLFPGTLRFITLLLFCITNVGPLQNFSNNFSRTRFSSTVPNCRMLFIFLCFRPAFFQLFLANHTYLSRCVRGMVQLGLFTCFRDSDFRADFRDLKHLMQTIRALEEPRQKSANEKGTSTRSHGCFTPSAHFELWL